MYDMHFPPRSILRAKSNKEPLLQPVRQADKIDEMGKKSSRLSEVV